MQRPGIVGGHTVPSESLRGAKWQTGAGDVHPLSSVQLPGSMLVRWQPAGGVGQLAMQPE